MESTNEAAGKVAPTSTSPPGKDKDVKVSVHGRVIKRKKFDDEDDEEEDTQTKKDTPRKETVKPPTPEEEKKKVRKTSTESIVPVVIPSTASPTSPITSPIDTIVLPLTPTLTTLHHTASSPPLPTSAPESPVQVSTPEKRRGPGRPPGSGKKQKMQAKAIADAQAAGLPPPVFSPDGAMVGVDTPKDVKKGKRSYKKRGPRDDSWSPSLMATGFEWNTQEAVQTKHNSFEQIAKRVKFSQRYTPRDLEERWQQLLYDDKTSDEAGRAIAAIPPSAKRVLWSSDEEELIRKETSLPNFSGFQNLLEKYRDGFHPSRTTKSLEAHFYRMKRTGLLKKDDPPKPTDGIPLAPQLGDIAKVEPTERKTLPLEQRPFQRIDEELVKINFSEKMDKDYVKTKKELFAKQEQYHQREILKYEKELVQEKEMEANSLALIRGKKLRYPIKSTQIFLGRNTKMDVVDVNLTEEGNASTISRKQAVIKLKHNFHFYIKNIGKHPIFINGKIVESGQKSKLLHNCIVEIADLTFIFEINTKLLEKIQEEMDASIKVSSEVASSVHEVKP